MATKMEQATQMLADMKTMAEGNATALAMIEQKEQEFNNLLKRKGFEQYYCAKKIDLDFYPINVIISSAGKELKKVFASSKSIYTYLTSSDIPINLPGFSKPKIELRISGRSNYETFGIELEGLPCMFQLKLKWDEKLPVPSQDFGELTGATGSYNSSKKEYIVGTFDHIKGIAHRFDVSVAAIMDINDMPSKIIEQGDVLIIPGNSFKASSPDNYEIHSAYYTQVLENMLCEGKDPIEVMEELKRLQKKGYKDVDSKKWGQENYGGSDEVISEDYRNPEGEISIHGYTNAEDGEPIRFCLHQSLDIKGLLPSKNSTTVYWEVQLPKNKERTFWERVQGIGGPEWKQSGPYWVFTGKLGEDDMGFDEFFPLAKKTGFTLVAIFSFGAAVYAEGTAAIIVSATNLTFTIDDDLGNSEESLVEQYLPEELKSAYNAGKVIVTIAGGTITFSDIVTTKSIDVIQALSLAKGIYGVINKGEKVIKK